MAETEKRVSIILADWNVRESFHAVDFLNAQTFPRSQYEIIWVEYYDHRPVILKNHHQHGRLDQWIVMAETGMYFKHKIYNAGVLAATGDIVVICDSDASFAPTFVESVVKMFGSEPDKIVLYLEEVRSDNRSFFPFHSFTWNQIMGAPGLMNWDSNKRRPLGLTSSHDPIHNRNYGACFCAARRDVIEAGGFDEHDAYHCFMCGPYELGWRLLNRGFREVWHEREWLLHTWHPWVKPETEIFGEHDGRGINALALEARKTRRCLPYTENPAIKLLRLARAPNNLIDAEPGHAVRESNVSYISPRIADGKISKVNIFGNLIRRPWVKRALIVTEFDPRDSFPATLESTGLVCDMEIFYYDRTYHQFGQAAMEAQLAMVAKHFAPDLMIVRPLAIDLGSRSEDPVEPNFNIIDAIANSGTIVYLHEPAEARLGAWALHSHYIGMRTLQPKKNGGAIFLRTYPDINPIVFREHQARRRDVNVTLWGSVAIGGLRATLLDGLSVRGIPVMTRPYRVPQDAYADVLSRSKIALSLPEKQDSHNPDQREKCPSRRALEILACGALMMEPTEGTSGKYFIAGQDYVSYESTEDLVEKIRHYIEHEDERKVIAASGNKKADALYSARAMWSEVFGACGFAPSRGGFLRKMQKVALQSNLAKNMMLQREARKIGRIKRAAIFGAGPSGEKCRLQLIAMGIEPCFYVDNDPQRQGKILGDLPIHPVSVLGQLQLIDGIVIAFQGNKTISHYQLAEIGYEGEIVDFDLIKKL